MSGVIGRRVDYKIVSYDEWKTRALTAEAKVAELEEQLVSERGNAVDKMLSLEAKIAARAEEIERLQFALDMTGVLLLRKQVAEQADTIEKWEKSARLLAKEKADIWIERDATAATIERLTDIDLLWDSFSQVLETIDQGQVQEESVMRYRDFRKCLDAALSKQEPK